MAGCRFRGIYENLGFEVELTLFGEPQKKTPYILPIRIRLVIQTDREFD